MSTPATDRPPARAAGNPWYVTAHTVQTRVVDGQLVELPVSVAHAKRMGTLLTACGAWADTWRKIHDLPFPLPLRWHYVLETCPECFHVVTGEWHA
jgi:hypothetical protein